ncbi:acyltransferase family protein [Enterococcus sp. DIV0187]|uniref:acyltransferase family protein n=1 Tax=Enterococcus sp. DIV0187 TaxID=2774644 RepID=UPI003F252C32
MDLIFLLIIFIIAITSVKNQDYINQQLSIQTTSNLQVIAVMFVMMHHLSQVLREYPDSFLSSRLIIAGRLAVGLFFFISGYGLIKQYKKKGDLYLRAFPRKKILSVFIPFILAMIVYFIYRNVLGYLSMSGALLSLINGSPVVSNGWFVIMIIYLYIAFFISAILARKKDSLLIVFLIISVILSIVFAKFLNYGEWWTNAVFCFPLGVIWSIKEKQLTNFLFQYYRTSVIVLATLFSCFFYLDEVSYTPLIRSLSVLCFTSIVVFINYKITFKNRFYQFIKIISFELYLYQGLFIHLFRSDVLFVNNRLLYVCLVIISTATLAVVMQHIAKLFSIFLVR